MKTRSDFVSNSSSCSFVIDSEHLESAVKLMDEKLYDLQIPSDIDNDIFILAFAKNKNVCKLQKLLNEAGYSRFPNNVMYANRDEDPEELSFTPMTFNVAEFIELVHEYNADIFCLMEKIEFNVEDYGTGPANLNDFYDFFLRNHCNPNADNTEHDFIDICKSNFKDVLKGLA